MKIAIDLTSARSGGGISYAHGLLKGLSGTDSENRYLLFLCSDQKHLLLGLPSNFQYRILSPWNNHHLFRALWQQVVLPWEARRFQADVVYIPTELIPFISSIPSVSLFQNWLPFVDDETFRKMGFPERSVWKNRLQRFLAKMASRRAKSIVFVSQASCDAISRKLHLPPERAAVVHHGIEREVWHRGQAQVCQDLPEAPFILAVGDFLAHKNHKTLAAAFSRLALQDGFPHHLVLVGRRWSKEIAEEVKIVIESFDLSNRVHLLESVPYEKLPAIYGKASILVLPSYVETFGIPVLEAMAMGVPVAASRLSAAPEICGDAAVFFDPWSAVEMASAMREVLSNPERASALGRKGYERSLQYRWEGSARETLSVLLRAAEQGYDR